MNNIKETFRLLSNKQIIELIDAYIRREDYRKILKDRMTKGYTYSQLASIYGFSEKQIKNIVYKSENVIYNVINSKLP